MAEVLNGGIDDEGFPVEGAAFLLGKESDGQSLVVDEMKQNSSGS